MSIDFLKPVLGDDLFTQVSEKLSESGITIANVSDGSYVPKAKFDEERNKAKTLTAQVNDLNSQLEEAKKNAGDAEALSKQIAKLTKDVEERDGKLSTLSRDYEIKDALRAAKVRDVDIVFGLLDKDKITSKDGKLKGAEEQINALKSSKSFLFEAEDKPSNRGGFSGQQDIIGSGGAESTNAAVNTAIRTMAGR